MSENTPNSARQAALDGPRDPSWYLYTPPGPDGPQNQFLRGEDTKLGPSVIAANFRRIAKKLREALASEVDAEAPSGRAEP